MYIPEYLFIIQDSMHKYSTLDFIGLFCYNLDAGNLVLTKEFIMKNKIIYIVLIIISIVLFALSMTAFAETQIIAPVIIVISIYLFIGALIKLCKTSEKLKNSIITAIDLLFFLP
jgi:hypothetical protein